MSRSAYGTPHADHDYHHRTDRLSAVALTMVYVAVCAEPVCAVADLGHAVPIGVLTTVTVSLLVVGGAILARRSRVASPQEVPIDVH